MALNPLESSWQKFHWACQHLVAVDDAFTKALKRYGDTETLKVEIETVGNKATAQILVAALPVLDSRCVLTLGDAIQNFRASLDHLIWALVRLGSTPQLKRPWLIQFPSARTATKFSNDIPNRMPGLDPTHLAIVKRYAPHRGNDGAKAVRLLQRLSNIDKHTVLIPAFVNMGDANLLITHNWPVTQRVNHFTQQRALKPRAKVVTLTLTRVGTDECQVKVEGQVMLYPSFGRGKHVFIGLREIRQAVLDILTEFDQAI